MKESVYGIWCEELQYFLVFDETEFFQNLAEVNRIIETTKQQKYYKNKTLKIIEYSLKGVV